MAAERRQGLSWAERLFGRHLRFGTNLVIAIVAVVGIITLVEAISLRHSHRFDLTANKRYSLSPQSQQLLAGLPQPVKATAFYQDAQAGRETAQDLLDQYAYYGQQFTYEFIDPDRNPGLAKRYGITAYGTIVLESGAKEEKVLMADEENLTNALLKVIREGQKTVYFLEGHGEHSIANTERDGYAGAKSAIESQNYTVKTLNLLTEGKLPDDVAILVVTGPRKDLLVGELAEITRFIERGGKVLFMLDPESPATLTKYLADYGIQVADGIVVDLVSRMFGMDYLTPVVSTYEPHPIAKGLEGVLTLFPLAQAVKVTETMPQGVSAQALAKTSPNSWLERGQEERATALRGEGRLAFEPGVDEQGPVPVVAVSTVTGRRQGTGEDGTKKARVVVFGDSDFASNNYLNVAGNRDLFLNTVSWLAEEENLIAIRPKEGGQFFQPVTADQERLIFWLSMIALPVVVMASGVANIRVEETARMSWKKTLGLVIVAALLGGYYYWYEVKGGEQRKAAEEAAQRLFQLNKDAIEAVTITRGHEVIKLAKDPQEGWMLTEPVRAKAEQRTVEDVLNGLVEGKRERVVAEQATDLSQFGLQEPGLVVAATVKDGATPTVLQIGARTPTMNGYYAREGDQTRVLVVPTSLQTKFDTSLFNLRDKTVLSLDQAQVKRLEVHQGEQLIAVEAAGEQSWKLVAPLEAMADKTKITDFMSAIHGAKVKEFVEETPQDLSAYGLNPPRWRLVFFVGDERDEKSLLLGNDDAVRGGIYAKRGAMDNVFLIDAKLMEKLPKDVSEWRDRRLMAFKRDEIERFEIHAGGEVTEVACVENCGKIPDDRWQIKQPLEAAADAIKVRTWLRNLEELKVKTFVAEAADDLAPYGLAQPQARLLAWRRNQSEPVTLLLGRQDVDQGGYYAQLPGRPAVYLIDTRDGDDLLKRAPDLRDRKLLAFKARDIRKIELTRADGTVVLEGDGENWQQVQPTKTTVEGHKVRSLLWKLEDLEFKEEWKAVAVGADVHGLETPVVALTLWDQGGKAVGPLKLGKPVEGRDLVYAQVASSPMIYAVDAKVLEGLPKGAGDI